MSTTHPAKQTASLPHPEKPCKFTTAHRRENGGFMQEISAIVMPTGYLAEYRQAHAVVTLRIYGTASRNYACLWTHGNSDKPEHHRNGSGQAGGCGYHRPSAAAQEAINNAGFVLSLPIDGRGDDAMREAVLAIADFLGFPGAVLHCSHA